MVENGRKRVQIENIVCNIGTLSRPVSTGFSVKRASNTEDLEEKRISFVIPFLQEGCSVHFDDCTALALPCVAESQSGPGKKSGSVLVSPFTTTEGAPQTEQIFPGLGWGNSHIGLGYRRGIKECSSVMKYGGWDVR